jgi:hypothetical protein
MKRALIATVILAACMIGCERNNTTAYDPQYDGITPITKSSPDMSILEDQRKLYDKLATSAAAAPPAAVPATPPAAPTSTTPPPPPG